MKNLAGILGILFPITQKLILKFWRCDQSTPVYANLKWKLVNDWLADPEFVILDRHTDTEMVSFSKMLISVSKSIWHYCPNDQHWHFHCCYKMNLVQKLFYFNIPKWGNAFLCTSFLPLNSQKETSPLPVIWMKNPITFPSWSLAKEIQY